MGLIEESIFVVYRKALEEGDVDQAQKAVELASFLKQKVELEGFRDHNITTKVPSPIAGSFFTPYPYRFYPEKGVVVIGNFAVTLTGKENKLFTLFSLNESSGKEIKIVTRFEIKNYLWGNMAISSNAIRIAIRRLREKLEITKDRPQILISVYGRGYIFLGKRVKDSE